MKTTQSEAHEVVSPKEQELLDSELNRRGEKRLSAIPQDEREDVLHSIDQDD